MRKLILRTFLSPGDIVLLTAAVRDLHVLHPDKFLTDVRTSCREIWENNPYITWLDEKDPEAEVIDCHYPLINGSNQRPYHAIHGYIQFLGDHLKLPLHPTTFRGDIHISDEEKDWLSQVHELTGEDTPFWIIDAGGKFDVTVKWWDVRRYQEVVDHFRGRIQFVQVGAANHYHPRLSGVIDLRGRTNLRQLIRLVYHADGVLCPVTALMHLAAAVESKPGRSPNRPCVVVAGGREPHHWEAYPSHQFIHTIGALPCCAHGGCWKTRVTPLNDGDERDKPQNLCANVVGNLPRCLDMITAADVIRRIGAYYEGGVLQPLTGSQQFAIGIAGIVSPISEDRPAKLTVATARSAAEEFLAAIQPYPDRFGGRGIVICAGGLDYLTNAWVCIRQLRTVGCTLPIQIWHLGPDEMDEPMKALFAQHQVECVDALEVCAQHPARILRGWELKPYSMLHCPFAEVLLLDADNVAVRNPEFLFDTIPYRDTGAVFWPDCGRLKAGHAIWFIAGISYRDEPEVESGQVLIDKRRAWTALSLCMWYNEHSDFFYRHIHGDKETFHLAFRKSNQPYAMPGPLRRIDGTLLQHDFEGNVLFQHRNGAKWNLFPRNRRIDGFQFEEQCLGFLQELREQWDGRVSTCYPQFTVAPSNHGSLRPTRRVVGSPRLVACMMSCEERNETRERTLAGLAATDWGNKPVRVRIDDAKLGSRQERLTETALLSLTDALGTDADFILFLEDDLEFNRHLRHNLLAWQPLREREITLAGLYNPNLRPKAVDVRLQRFIPDPNSIFGSQAFLLSRNTVEYLVQHWSSVQGMPDIKMSRLAARLKLPLFYHYPSLVQHVGRQSVWGGRFHQAIDFDVDWRAPG